MCYNYISIYVLLVTERNIATHLTPCLLTLYALCADASTPTQFCNRLSTRDRVTQVCWECLGQTSVRLHMPSLISTRTKCMQKKTMEYV